MPGESWWEAWERRYRRNGETAKRLIGGYLFLRISGGWSVDFEDAERIEYGIYLLNRIVEEKSRMRWEGAGILTG
jgi:hypothetical protein